MNSITGIGSPFSLPQVPITQYADQYAQSTPGTGFAPMLSEAQARIDNEVRELHRDASPGVSKSDLDNPVKYGVTNADMIQYLESKYLGNQIHFTAFGLSKEPLIPEDVIQKDGQLYFKIKDSDKLIKINLVGYQGKEIVPYKEPVVLDPRQTVRYQSEQFLTNAILSAGSSETSLSGQLSQGRPDPQTAALVQQRNASQGDFFEYTNLSNQSVRQSQFIYDNGRLRLLDGTPMAEQFAPSDWVINADNTITKQEDS